MSTYEVHPEPSVTDVWVETTTGAVRRWKRGGDGWSCSVASNCSWGDVLTKAVRWHDHDPTLDGIPSGPWQIAGGGEDSRRALDGIGELVVIVNAAARENEPKIARFVVDTVNARLARSTEQAGGPPNKRATDLTAPTLAELGRYRSALEEIRAGHHACEYVRVAELALDGDS